MILAKPDETLIEHIENALMVFSSIRVAYPDIPELCGVKRFWENLFFAVFFHDFGKAAKGFQNQLKGGKKWGYRHEILSAGFISALNLSDKDKKAIGLSIITHHKDIEELREKYATYPEDNPGYKKFVEHSNELDFEELNNIIDLIPDLSKKYLGKVLNNFHNIDNYSNLADVYKNYVLPYYKEFKTGEKTILHGKYGIFIKGFLTACDHLASAGKTEIKKAVNNIDNYIKFDKLTSVQSRAKEHKKSIFLISPTGSGKTEAALFWAHSNQNESNGKRIFYILPYTASINFMYKRLVKLFKNDNLVSILHGKSSYFLYKFLSEGKEKYDYKELTNVVKQYQSLSRKIFKPYKVLTPFQIIKAFFSLKGFEQNISEMSKGLFIFDEIHSYDPRNTALILETCKFIKNELKGKILFMSATIPKFLKDIFSRELDIKDEIRMEPDELKNIKRHKIIIKKGNLRDYLKNISDDIKNKKRVLVVTNTVKAAQEIYSELRKTISDSALLHSRFILRDREKIESELDKKKLLVGTQVIEVSLDIDYDVLYTEPAPIDALLQRMGRVNRRGRTAFSPVYVFTETSENGYIYEMEKTKKSIEVLKSVDILNEYEIQSLVDSVYENGYDEKEKDIIRKVSESFKALSEANVPFVDVNKKESDFYKMFDNVEVIPSCFFDEYMSEIENKRYFEAMKYILSISLYQYNILKSKNRISRTDYGIMADVDYDKELGLIIKTEEEAEIL